MQQYVNTIEPQQAAMMLQNNNLNRKPSKSIIRKYSKSMAEGDWILNGESIKFDVSGNLLDGQHRLHACIDSNCSFETSVVTDLPTSSFTTIDTGKVRSNGDSLYISGHKNVNILAAVVRTLNALEGGDTKISNFNGGRSGMNNSDVVGYIERHNDVTDNVNAFVNKYKGALKLFGSASAVTLYHLFKEKDEKLAHELFSQLSTGVTNDEDSIIINLRNRIIDKKIHKESMRNGYKMLVIIRLWNKLRRNVFSGRATLTNAEELPSII